MLSSMSGTSFDATHHARIAELGQRVLAGQAVTREEAGWLFELESAADIFDLLSWANRIRSILRATRSIFAR